MSSQWTNKYAIMRDLSMAQGCVPVKIDRTVGKTDRPPALEIVEETEEQFFRHCSGDATNVKPDLGLIKTMLDLVRVDEDSDPDETPKNGSKSIVITKIPATNVKYEVVNTGNSNVARPKIMSKADNANTPVLLKKPSDFEFNTATGTNNGTTHTKIATIDNVKAWCNSQPWPETETPKRIKKKELVLKPVAMFTKKSGTPATGRDRVEPVVSPVSVIKQYSPTKWAETYEKSLMERQHMNVVINEDVWARVERQMKEIECKKKHELLKAEESRRASFESEVETRHQDGGSESPTGSNASTSTYHEDKSNEPFYMILPQHRHMLTGTSCIVCERVRAYQERERESWTSQA